jgi:uncharacterized protein
VVIGPMRGGQLVKVQPAVVKAWEEPGMTRSRVEWGLDWVLNQKAVFLALSGMSSMEQTAQNVSFASRSAINLLSPADFNLYKEIVTVINSLSPVACTACQYCQPCPDGVNIPGIFELYNDQKVNENYPSRSY